jgi:isoleucyl-tRNA synthetase
MNANSVHLEEFPMMTNFRADDGLVASMDKIMAVCSTALSVRDKNNLRVRLPLNEIVIISQNVEDMRDLSQIVKEEINVKNVSFLTDIENYGEKSLALNFSKIGAKVGSKMQNVIRASKNGNWKINEHKKLEIEGFELDDAEYEISWIPKEQGVFVVDKYDILIRLDLNITRELELEGIARDVVRLIQQCRKLAELSVSDKINLLLWTTDDSIKDAILSHKDYIQYQTLADQLGLKEDRLEFAFEEKIDNNVLHISFNKVK